MVQGHGVVGGFVFQEWNIIEVVTTHRLIPLVPSRPHWLAAARFCSGPPLEAALPCNNVLTPTSLVSTGLPGWEMGGLSGFPPSPGC